jgi:peptide methionine sulfoxide reductase MsrA
VVATRTGYAGGTLAEPRYHLVGDHLEAVEVTYDPARTSYEDLLAVFWASHPTAGAPGPSRTREAALYAGEGQRRLALDSRRAVARRTGERVSSAVLPLGSFWPAEEMHQKSHLQRLAPGLVAELATRHGGLDAFLASTAAARLNSYLGGFAGETALAEAAAELGLNPAELRRRLARRH